MDKKFKRKKDDSNTISYGKIGRKTSNFDLESETIKEKSNPDK